MKSAENYVERIMRDDLGDVTSETPTVFDNERIERIYEFRDGAVVSYEWQDISLRQFNHRFTLVALPNPNPEKLKKGIIRVIEYK